MGECYLLENDKTNAPFYLTFTNLTFYVIFVPRGTKERARLRLRLRLLLPALYHVQLLLLVEHRGQCDLPFAENYKLPNG